VIAPWLLDEVQTTVFNSVVVKVPLSSSLGKFVDVNVLVEILYTTVAVPYLTVPAVPLKLLAHVHKHVDSTIQVPFKLTDVPEEVMENHVASTYHSHAFAGWHAPISKHESSVLVCVVFGCTKPLLSDSALYSPDHATTPVLHIRSPVAYHASSNETKKSTYSD